MKIKYEQGDEFKLTENALANYGEKHRDKIFTISEWFDHCGTDEHGHPGFDECAGSAIYDIEELEFSLYEWEMIAA